MLAFLKRIFFCLSKFFGKLVHVHVCKKKTDDSRKDDESNVKGGK